MTDGLLGDDLAPTSCPRCGGGLEAVHSTRMIPVGGRWRKQGDPWWAVHCANAHQATGDTLQAAIEHLSGARRR
jgi:hypothetical protein